MSQNDIIIRTHYKSPHRLHIDSDIPTPSSEPINQFARQLITLLDTSDLSSMLSYCVDWPPESPDNQYHLNK